jgi:hypothetical protein
MPRLFVKITAADQAKLAALAAKRNLTVSEWIRWRCGLEPARSRGNPKLVASHPLKADPGGDTPGS